MRKKSDAKRQAILTVAAQLFSEMGFERTSMAEMCARVGGSKATLYNYFPSKEMLFFEVMFQATEDEFNAIHHCLDPENLRVDDALFEFGKRFLTFLYSPQVLRGRRLVIAEAERSELGRICYEKGPKQNHAMLSEYLEKAIRQGKLRDSDKDVASAHLIGLLQSEVHDPQFHCAREPMREEEISACTRRAIDVFMRAYGPFYRSS